MSLLALIRVLGRFMTDISVAIWQIVKVLQLLVFLLASYNQAFLLTLS